MTSVKNNAPLRAALVQALLICKPSVSGRREFKAGEEIFHEGSSARGCYVIDTGEVELTADEGGYRHMVVQTVGPGELLGLSAVMSRPVYGLSAHATRDTTAHYISRRQLKHCIEKNPQLSALILGALSNSVRSLLTASARLRCQPHRSRHPAKPRAK
jgi:CRP/FNR family transcriptional regulator, cyclic AMP receptor protein